MKSSLLPPGAVLMSCIATIGKCGITSIPSFTNQQINSVIPDGKTDSLFLYYIFTRLGHDLDSVGGGGSVYVNVSKSRFSDIEVSLPPLPEQRAIADVLGTLDDKIELNRRMNETLEAMARALFRDWFVDFGPVRAKMAGREPYLPPDVWSLFPDRLAPSELGDIPAGWQVKTLGQLIELAYGKALREQDRRPGSIPVYGSNGQVGWHDTKLVDGPGIVVGRKGNPGLVRWAPVQFYPIDTTFYVVPMYENLSLHFLFYALDGQDLPSIAADSAVPGLNRNLAYMNRQIMPPRGLIAKFHHDASAIFNRRDGLETECRDLTALRDALLPSLVSGGLRVANDRNAGGSSDG